MIISGVIRVLFWPNYTGFCWYTQQVSPKLQAVYSLEGKHLWYRVLKCVMLLEIHVYVTVHCLCLLVLPLLFSFNWDMGNKWCKWCKVNKTDTCNIMILRNIFLLPISTKMMNCLRVGRMWIHLFSVDLITVHRVSAKKGFLCCILQISNATASRLSTQAKRLLSF